MEDGAPGVGSCRHFPSWTKTEPRKLGESPAACQGAKSKTGTGSTSMHMEEPWDCAASKGNGQSGVPESSQSVGLKNGWSGYPPPTLSPEEPVPSNPHPSGPHPTAKSLKLPPCSGSQGHWSASVLHNDQSPSLPECSTCFRCPASPITRTQCNIGP